MKYIDFYLKSIIFPLNWMSMIQTTGEGASKIELFDDTYGIKLVHGDKQNAKVVNDFYLLVFP